VEACLERGVLSIPVLYSARLLYSLVGLVWMSACTESRESSGMVRKLGMPDLLDLPELCVCSREKGDEGERDDWGLVSKVEGKERSALLGCGTDEMSE
jgi:hypothetical protein